MEKIVENYMELAKKHDFTFSFSEKNQHVYELSFKKDEKTIITSNVFIYSEFIYFSMEKFKQKHTKFLHLDSSPLLPYFLSFQENLAKELNAAFLICQITASFQMTKNRRDIKEKFNYASLRDIISDEEVEFFVLRPFALYFFIKDLKPNAFLNYFHRYKAIIDVFHSFQEKDPTFDYSLEYSFKKPHLQLKQIDYYLDGEEEIIFLKENEQIISINIKDKTNIFHSLKEVELFLEDYLKRRQQGLRLKGQLSPPKTFFNNLMYHLEGFSEYKQIQDKIHDKLLYEENLDYKIIERAAQEYVKNYNRPNSYYLNDDRVVYFSFLEKTFILSLIDDKEEPFYFTSCSIENTQEEVEKAVMMLSKYQFNEFLDSNKHSNERFN